MTKKERITALEAEVGRLQEIVVSLRQDVARLLSSQQVTYGPTKQWPYDPIKLTIDC